MKLLRPAPDRTDDPGDERALSPETIRRALTTADGFTLGQECQREGRVLLINWSKDRRRLMGVAKGRRERSYVCTADLADAGRVITATTCTCVFGGGCKHVAAVLLEAWARSAGTTSAPGATGRPAPAPPWQQVLAPVMRASSAPERPSGTDEIGLRFRVEDSVRSGAPRRGTWSPAPRSASSGGWAPGGGWGPPSNSPALAKAPAQVVASLSVRPVRRVADAWVVGSGAHWPSPAHYYSYSSSYSSQRSGEQSWAWGWLADLAAAYSEYYPSGDWRSLDEFSGRVLWPLLAQGRDAGIAFVGTAAGHTVEWADETALALDVRQGQGQGQGQGGWRLTRRLLADGRPFDCEVVGLIGNTGLFGVRQEGRQRTILLGPTARRLGDADAALLRLGDLVIDDDDRAQFLADTYPTLRRRVTVVSSDASAELPAPPRPVLTVAVRFPDVRTAEARWAWDYGGQARPWTWQDDESRDRDQEREVVARVEAVLARRPGAGPAGRHLFQGVDAVAFAETLDELRALDHVVVRLEGDRPDYREAVEAPLVSVAVAEGDDPDWFDLGVTITVEGQDIPFAPLFAAIARGEDRLITDDGTVLRTDLPVFDRLRELIEEAQRLTDRTGGLRLNRYAASLWGDFEELADVVEQADRWRASVGALARLAAGEVAPEPVPVPGTLRAELRPYQVAGYQWLAFLRHHGLGGILADDMGLGKTVEVLALVAHALEESRGQGLVGGGPAEGVAGGGPAEGAAGGGSVSDTSGQGAVGGGSVLDTPGLGVSPTAAPDPATPPDRPFLVVAPASVVANWGLEAARFTPGVRCAVLATTVARCGETLADLAAGADLVVTSYAIFRLDFDDFAAVEWAGLILDEAQFLKNPKTRTNECARLVPAPFKLAVTGTPMENNLMELWALLAVTAPGLFSSPTRFREDYVTPVNAGVRGRAALTAAARGHLRGYTEQDRADDEEAAATGDATLARLRRRLKPLLLRRTKEQVAPELPDRIEQELAVELAPRHRRIYDTLLARERSRVLGLLDDYQANRFEIFRSLMLLRRAALDATLIDPKAYAGVPSAKLDVLFEQIDDVVASGHRALVFSQFTTFLARIGQRAAAAGVAYEYLDGSTRRRADVIKRFRSGDAPLFLISLKAGGFGLNLTEADYVFLMDPWWNPATENQAIDRTHRIGQTRTVMVFRLVSSGTIEDKVMALKARKARLFDAVLDDDSGAFAQALAADDIRGLFEE